MAELVSIIMPVHNAAPYLDESLESVCNQTYRPLQIIIFDDCSSDNSWEKLCQWSSRLIESAVNPILAQSEFPSAKGPGFARNQCVYLSEGNYLCHLDADDVMSAERVQIEYDIARREGEFCLVGSNFSRIPLDSTPYYTGWLNGMNAEDIMLQQFRECTLICPSWFMHRSIYNRIAEMRGGRAYVESSETLSRIPEDLFFFMDHLLLGGTLAKSSLPLVQYRYSPNSWSLGTKSIDMQKVRISYLQQRILDNWANFSIWGYGRDGKKFLALLSDENAKKVTCFCDIDPKKIGRDYFSSRTRHHIPIIHFREVKAPFIVCVASKMAGGALEENIRECNFVEGVDYFHFC
jgi:glycosyltransferase involved in cell wall biosynthesis